MRWLITSLMLASCMAACQNASRQEPVIQSTQVGTSFGQEPVDPEVKAYLAMLEEQERQTIDARLGGESSRCGLHQVRLREGVVPLTFGFPVWPEDDARANLELFPNANSFHPTCVVSDARFARVRYCRVCRMVQAQWENGKRGDKIQVPSREELAREEKEEEAAGFR